MDNLQDDIFVSANQKPSDHPSDDLQDDIFVLANQKPSEHPSKDLQGQLLYRPITYFGQIILWTDFRIGQSRPLDGSSFGRTFASANHILRTDHLSDGPLSRPIRILQRILRTILKLTSFSRPIRIFRTNPQENQVTRMVTDHTSDETQKSRLSTTRHSNDLGSQVRDG